MDRLKVEQARQARFVDLRQATESQRRKNKRILSRSSRRKARLDLIAILNRGNWQT
jgi:hypothetical protein